MHDLIDAAFEATSGLPSPPAFRACTSAEKFVVVASRERDLRLAVCVAEDAAELRYRFAVDRGGRLEPMPCVTPGGR